jgi:hypothetical protein
MILGTRGLVYILWLSLRIGTTTLDCKLDLAFKVFFLQMNIVVATSILKPLNLKVRVTSMS